MRTCGSAFRSRSSLPSTCSTTSPCASNAVTSPRSSNVRQIRSRWPAPSSRRAPSGFPLSPATAPGPGAGAPHPPSRGPRILLTANDRDGTLAGPDVELVAAAAANGCRVVAAGGVRSPEDALALHAAGAEAVVVGRALLYFLKRA